MIDHEWGQRSLEREENLREALRLDDIMLVDAEVGLLIKLAYLDSDLHLQSDGCSCVRDYISEILEPVWLREPKRIKLLFIPLWLRKREIPCTIHDMLYATMGLGWRYSLIETHQIMKRVYLAYAKVIEPEAPFTAKRIRWKAWRRYEALSWLPGVSRVSRNMWRKSQLQKEALATSHRLEIHAFIDALAQIRKG